MRNMNIFKIKKIKKESLELFLAKLDLDTAKHEIENMRGINSWFINQINNESERMFKQGKTPSKLLLKQDIPGKKIAAFMTAYGILTVSIDENMKEIIRIE